MSIQDKIAEKLLKTHSDLLVKVAGGWDMELEEVHDEPLEYRSTNVTIGNTRISCQVAKDPEAQVLGLQRHAGLQDFEGMLFPYDTPRKVTYHMASVSFSIDILFVGSDGRITKIVDHVEPGSLGKWSMPNTKAVIGVNAGFCDANKIKVSDEVDLADDAPATAHTSMLEVTAQESYPTAPRKDIDPLMVPGNDTLDRFKGHDLVDVQVDQSAMDQLPIDNFKNFDPTYGYDPVTYHDPIDGDEEAPAPTRPAP